MSEHADHIEHVSDTELVEFALGELSSARLPAFEAHVSSCDDCACRLAREARLEIALGQVHAAARPPRRLLVSRRTGAALATFALAASLFLLFYRGADRPGAPPAVPSVVCADGPDQAACVQRAQRHGLYVQYPDWADSPPFGPRDPSQGPSVTPFPVGRLADR